MNSSRDNPNQAENAAHIQASSDYELLILKNEHQFFLFFTALIFTTLSFAVQFPSLNLSFYLNILQIVSWAVFTFSGLLSLLRIRIFQRRHIAKSIPEWKWLFYIINHLGLIVWITFILGIILQIIFRSFYLLSLN